MNDKVIILKNKIHLEVIGQFSAASVAGVHGDEDRTRRVEGDLRPLKHERLQLFCDGSLNCLNLLGNH